MKLHALVEGPSEQHFLELWGRRFLPDCELRVHPHQGKGTLPKLGDKNQKTLRLRRGLLDQLPAKLAALGKALDHKEERVVVLIDADSEDLTQLRADLAALAASLVPAPVVKFCFAVEELEAFYLGDLKALAAAYPGHDQRLLARYQPDSICGTWEYFGQVIGDDGGNKVAWAEAMGSKLTTKPEQSRSPSFKDFCRDLIELTQRPGESVQRPKKPRKAKAATPRDATGKRHR